MNLPNDFFIPQITVVELDVLLFESGKKNILIAFFILRPIQQPYFTARRIPSPIQQPYFTARRIPYPIQ